MNTKSLIFCLILAIFALPAAAQDIAGKWEGSMESPQGAFSMGFKFMVEDDELKGTMSNDFMGELPISDGKIDGNEISFKVAMQGGPGGGNMTLTYTGKLEGDKIMLTMGFEGGPAGGGPPGDIPPLTLTRAKE